MISRLSFESLEVRILILIFQINNAGIYDGDGIPLCKTLNVD